MPRTPILGGSRPPPLRSGRRAYDLVDEAEHLPDNQKPASLRSDGVHLRAGMMFDFHPERCPDGRNPRVGAGADRFVISDAKPLPTIVGCSCKGLKRLGKKLVKRCSFTGYDGMEPVSASGTQVLCFLNI